MTAPLPEDNLLAARLVTRACRKAALATVDVEGAPYVSLVTVGFDHDLSPLLLISRMSAHTKNVEADPRVSFLFDGTEGYDNPQAGPRLTLTGRAAIDPEPRLKARFLARHPAAQGYAGFGDFALWRVKPGRGQFVGGFGRAQWLDAPFGLGDAVIGAFTAGEERLMARLAEAGRTEIAAVDPDGYDVISDGIIGRRNFDVPADSPDQALSWILATAV